MRRDVLLSYAASTGIIDMDAIELAVEEMKNNEIVEKYHSYAIWKNEKGLWCTHIRDEEGNVKIRRRKTQRELISYLAKHYKHVVNIVRINDVFEQWINEKIQYGEIRRQSYDRYVNDYKRFFSKDLSITKKEFCYITEDDLEHFIKRTIYNNKLTRKSYSGLVTLLKGIFRYGKRAGYTDLSITNFFGDLMLSNSIFERKYKDRDKEVFNEDEVECILTYLKYNQDIWNLGLKLQFETGARIGEIAALRFEDTTEDSILIRRTEVKYRDDDGKWRLEVAEVPKTEAGYREIFLPAEAQNTLRAIKELNSQGTFLFENEGKRIRSGTFNHRLTRVCEKIGIPPRSTHKIRKTYGTTLIDNNVDDSIVAEQMGHKDISTTRKIYYYSNKSRANKREQVRAALKGI